MVAAAVSGNAPGIHGILRDRVSPMTGHVEKGACPLIVVTEGDFFSWGPLNLTLAETRCEVPVWPLIPRAGGGDLDCLSSSRASIASRRTLSVSSSVL